jgi:hypothetical protein
MSKKRKTSSKVLISLIILIIFAISVIIPTTLYIKIAEFFGVVSIFANEAILKSLIEGEITILGFLGLIVVYVLTSLDNKEDRYERMLFDLITQEKDKVEVADLAVTSDDRSYTRHTTKDRGKSLNEVLSQIERQRGSIIDNSSVIGIQLVISMLLSIWALGVSDVELAGRVSIFAVMLFVSSIASLFFMFRKVAKTYVHIRKILSSHI